MKIGLLTISHNRPQIDKCFCLMVERLRNDFPDIFLPLCVVSIEEEKDIFEQYGVETYLFPNNPVGKKHNFGLDKLKGRCSHVFHIGSDDIVDNNYVVNLLKGSDKDITWGQGLVFYSVKFKTARYWEEPFRTIAGPGKLISAKLLNKANWHIWDDDIDKGLDNSAFQTLSPFIESKYVFITKPTKSLFVDIKSEVNINPYRGYANHGREIGLPYIFEKLSQKEVDYLKSLN